MNNNEHRKSNHPFIIGLFVITGAVLLTVVIIWLGASQFFKENVKYVTYFDGSIEGLEQGSPVKYLGVPVGSVSKIDVAPDGKLVEVILQIDKKLEVNDSLRVKAELAGLAGGKFLQLNYPSNPALANMYPKLSFNTPYKVIKSTPSGIEEMEIAARDVVNNLMKLNVSDISDGTVRFLNAGSDFFESKSLNELIDNLDKAGYTLKNILGRADTSNIIANVAYTSQLLVRAAKSLQQFSDTLSLRMNALQLNEKLDRVINVYDSAIANTTTNFKSLSTRMGSAIINLNEMLEQMKLAAFQIRKTIKGISENPTPINFTEPPPPEK